MYERFKTTVLREKKNDLTMLKKGRKKSFWGGSILGRDPSHISVKQKFIQQILCNPAGRPTNEQMDMGENITSSVEYVSTAVCFDPGFNLNWHTNQYLSFVSWKTKTFSQSAVCSHICVTSPETLGLYARTRCMWLGLKPVSVLWMVCLSPLRRPVTFTVCFQWFFITDSEVYTVAVTVRQIS